MFRMTHTSKAGQRESLDFDTREAAVRYARQEYGIPALYWSFGGGYTVEVSYYGEVVSIREAVEEPEARTCIPARGGKVHLADPWHMESHDMAFPYCRTGSQNNRGTAYIFAPEGSEITCAKCKGMA
jgi:hypothetical protein